MSLYVCMYVSVCLCMSLYVCMYVSVCLCMYVCMYTYMFIHILLQFTIFGDTKEKQVVLSAMTGPGPGSPVGHIDQSCWSEILRVTSEISQLINHQGFWWTPEETRKFLAQPKFCQKRNGFWSVLIRANYNSLSSTARHFWQIYNTPYRKLVNRLYYNQTRLSVGFMLDVSIVEHWTWVCLDQQT